MLQSQVLRRVLWISFCEYPCCGLWTFTQWWNGWTTNTDIIIPKSLVSMINGWCKMFHWNCIDLLFFYQLTHSYSNANVLLYLHPHPAVTIFQEIYDLYDKIYAMLLFFAKCTIGRELSMHKYCPFCIKFTPMEWGSSTMRNISGGQTGNHRHALCVGYKSILQ